MLLFLKLLPGAFLGWGLGANDTSNIFGTAVANKIIRFSTAAVITSVFILIGSFLEGEKTFFTVGKLFEKLYSKDIFSITLGTAVAVYLFTYLKLPISTSQALVGAMIGVGLINGESINFSNLIKIIIAWITTPIGAFVFGFLLYMVLKWIFSKIRYGIMFYSAFIKFGIIVAGAIGAYSLGSNNVGNITGIYAMHMSMGIPARIWALLGGIFIVFGVITYSKRVMETIGKKITEMVPLMALVAVLSHSLTVYVFTHIGVPVSSSQAIVGAVAGVGSVNGLKSVNFRMLGKIGTGWIFTPVSSFAFSIIIRLLIWKL